MRRKKPLLRIWDIKNILFLGGALIAFSILVARDSGFDISPYRQDNRPSSLQHEVTVALKLIQVYVTDKSGNPVRDLTKDEFIVLDNSKPVTISAFEKHDLITAPTGVEKQTPEPLPELKLIVAPIMSRKFIVLFDFAFNTGRGIAVSIEAVRHFLDNEVRPEDELAFISYSMLRGLKVHEFFTTDHAKIKAALATISSKDIAGRAEDVEQAYWLVAHNPDVPPDDLARIEMDRWDSARQAQNYFNILTRLAKALRLIQGQKNILFFSGGVPSSLINSSRSVGTDSVIAQKGSGASKGSRFEVGNFELRPLQEAMSREFSASSCSIYTFDTRESSKIPALFDVDQLGLRTGAGALNADAGIFRDDKTTGMDSLKSMSKQTGGKYYSNITLSDKNLNEVSTATGTYYVLGYPIPSVADGEFHNIKIEVKRKGCRVRTQPGYFNPKPFREYTNIEKNIHLLDLALNERSEFQAPNSLQISALYYDPGQGSRIRALVRIPDKIWRQFTGQTAEIVSLFFDAQDNLMSLQRIAVPLAEYCGKEVLFSSAISAQTGPIKCRIIIRDLDSGRSAIASTTAYPGPSSKQTLSVFSPLLVVEGGGLFSLEGVVKGAAETPSWRGIYGYDASAFSPVFGDEPVGVREIGVILPYSAPGISVSNLTFKANLVNSSTGENLAVPLEVRESTTQETVKTQRLRISLEDVPNGKYFVYIHVGNKVTDQVASASVSLVVGR